MQRGGTVYMMTNKTNSVLYTGVTSDLIKRVQEHRNSFYNESFTDRYNVHKLVYFKSFLTIEEAILEEKRIKGGNRQKKLNMITNFNPEWNDLWDDIKNW